MKTPHRINYSHNVRRSVVLILALALLIALVACGGSSFTIVGKWRNVGDSGFGQAQPGAIIVFDDTNCNLYSPLDTYALYQEGGKYYLDITSFLFGEPMTFDVEVTNRDNIKLTYSGNVIELKRAE